MFDDSFAPKLLLLVLNRTSEAAENRHHSTTDCTGCSCAPRVSYFEPHVTTAGQLWRLTSSPAGDVRRGQHPSSLTLFLLSVPLFFLLPSFSLQSLSPPVAEHRNARGGDSERGGEEEGRTATAVLCKILTLGNGQRNGAKPLGWAQPLL